MTKPATVKPNAGHLALGVLVLVLLAVALAAAKPWLKATIGDLAFDLVAVAGGILAMGYATFAALRIQRGLDEVQKAGTEFAARWSLPAGQAAFLFLLLLPPVKDLMTSLVIEFGDPGPGMTVDGSVVKFAMVLGFVGVVLLQAIATMVFNAIWWKSKQ
jgi:hypothetical protein